MCIHFFRGRYSYFSPDSFSYRGSYFPGIFFHFFHFFYFFWYPGPLVLWSLRALDRPRTGFMVQGRWSESFLVPESTGRIFAKSGKASAFRPLQANVVARREGHTRRTSRSQKTWKMWTETSREYVCDSACWECWECVSG